MATKMRMNCRQPAGAVHLGAVWRANTRRAWWSQHREASFNWLALGMLLAAWNVSDHDTERPARRRPDSLRGYASVSVRAAAIHSVDLRTSSSNGTRGIHESVKLL